jgi:hypothetical protein
MTARPIGGFFPIRLPGDGASKKSVLSHWIPPGARAWLLQNARSALHALWVESRPAKVWLPAYICAEVAAAVPDSSDVGYYPLDAALAPSIPFLAAEVDDRHHVLAVDYFGRPPGDEFLALVHSRSTIGWIEDRAQALDTGADPWGDWVLYSPRKLLGVADGGILVAHRKALPPIATDEPADLAFMLPALERFEDIGEVDNARWYTSFQAVESRMIAGRIAMSRVSRSILSATDIDTISMQRKHNYEVLHALLGEWAFFPESTVGFAPLGFPIRTNSGAESARALAAQRIFAARHWASLPSDQTKHANEHALAASLVTLPCDDRYDETDMQRLAAVTRSTIVAAS